MECHVLYCCFLNKCKTTSYEVLKVKNIYIYIYSAQLTVHTNIVYFFIHHTSDLLTYL